MKKILFSSLLFGLIACGPQEAVLVVPNTYKFENVNYNEKTNQIKMLKELSIYAKSANAPAAPPLNAVAMRNMYYNTNQPFDNSDLNNATVSLSKDISRVNNAEDLYIRSFALLADLSAYTNRVASPGVAGIATSLDGNSTYLLSANGVELPQLIEKGLGAACMYYQATNNYLGYVKMNVDNKAVQPGKGTLMQYHWDQAFGYFGAPIDFPSNTTNLELWSKYSNKVSVVLGSSSRIMTAFRTGRAAINISDYVERDRQIAVIRQQWELVLAAVAISYLNDAKRVSNDPALYYHYLTEAYAFLMGIKHSYGRTIVTDAAIDNLLETLAGDSDPLNANFYLTALQDINNTIDATAIIYTQLEAVKNAL